MERLKTTSDRRVMEQSQVQVVGANNASEGSTLHYIAEPNGGPVLRILTDLWYAVLLPPEHERKPLCT